MTLTHTAFDAIAATYDDEFTHTPIAQLMRRAVWARLDANFRAGMRVLELGCGTGEDAIHLAQRGVHVTATDASTNMLAITWQKAERMGVSEWVETYLFDMNRNPNRGSQIPTPAQASQSPSLNGSSQIANRNLQFDGVFSNFGALNCISHLPSLISNLSTWTRPKASVVLVVMGPLCLWEIVWHLLHGQPRGAFRRWARSGAVANIGRQQVRVYYPSARRLIKLCAPTFRHVRTSGLGVLLPPPYVSVNSKQSAVNREKDTAHCSLFTVHRSLFTVHWLETRVAHLFPFNQCGDHYILELERQ